MLTRIIVAVIAIPILVLIVFFAPLWLLGVTIGVIAARSAWEFLRCSETALPRRMWVITAICAFALPVCTVFFPTGRVYEITLFFLSAYLFCELMLSFRREAVMGLDAIAVPLLAGGILPILITAVVRLGLRENGSVYALLPFVAAFSCDSGAYFVGCGVGKHKLAPHLSPNKTVEGSAGGILAAIIAVLLYGVILKAAGFTVDFLVMAVYGFLGAVVCELGDLSFSAIKRICNVKDYGSILLGHGGMLDRFDSMFWTAALMELLVAWVPAISKLVE